MNESEKRFIEESRMYEEDPDHNQYIDTATWTARTDDSIAEEYLEKANEFIRINAQRNDYKKDGELTLLNADIGVWANRYEWCLSMLNHKMERGKKYLHFGCGSGSLEWINEERNMGITLVASDYLWDTNRNNYQWSIAREIFGVSIDREHLRFEPSDVNSIANSIESAIDGESFDGILIFNMPNEVQNYCSQSSDHNYIIATMGSETIVAETESVYVEGEE